jgi:hypothetical protein
MKREIATPDLETIRAIGRSHGHFGEEYYVIGANGIRHTWNQRAQGKNLVVSVRYKLRNEFNIPSKRIDALLTSLASEAEENAK